MFKRLTPYPYQQADIDHLSKHNGTGLVVTEVGGGKTLVAIETALRIKAKTVLVIAPQGTHVHAWQKTLQRQTDGKHSFRRVETSKKGKAALADLMWDEPGWYICTPQWFARQKWTGVKPDYVIFDEIHVAGAYGNATRKKLHQLKGKARLGLSGTPLRNKIENAWAIVKWINPDLMPDNFWLWRMSPDLLWKYDHFSPQQRKITGEVEPGKIVNSLPCYIQHLQREKCCDFHPAGFIPDLPEPAVEIRTIQMTPAQRRFYSQMEESFVAWLSTPDPTTGDRPVVAELPIVARGMLRFCALGLPSVDEETGKLYFEDDCESPKFTELLTVLAEMGEAPALVLTHSQKYASMATKRLIAEGVSAFEWSGANSQKKRDAALTALAGGDIRVIVAVITAIGTGTDGLQEATNTEIWMSEEDDPTANQQTKGRLDRPGQKRQVVRIYIRAEGTHDEGIYSKNLEKALSMARSLRKRGRNDEQSHAMSDAMAIFDAGGN